MSIDHGFKMSKEGRPVGATGAEDFIFSTQYPVLNIKKRESLTVTTSDEDFPPFVTATYNHDFGYVPQFMAFTKSYSSENFGKFSLADYVNLNIDIKHEIAGANLYEKVEAYTTKDDLIVRAKIEEVVSGFAAGKEHTYTIDFILFMEEAVPLDD